MKTLQQKKLPKIAKENPSKPLCAVPFCFFCTMNEQNPSLRASRITGCFKQMPLRDDPEYVLALSGLWNIAMTRPDNPEFPSLGIFECMAKLITRGTTDEIWLFTDQNIYIPYYAAHIIGSYTMNKPQFAEMAVESGVIPPLMELLRGRISWVEQRVAVRALGHLASHESTFESVAENHGAEMVELAMEISSTCMEKIYRKFICMKERLKYQRNLLSRGLGGLEMEDLKAEEWASQIQSWSLHLLNCFARKEKFLDLICRKKFLKNLSQMWGGVVNPETPGGIGLLRTLSYTETGRNCMADSEKVVKSLCNLARSSDDWQFKAIDCLLNLLKDPQTRFQVFETTVFSLLDLVELRDHKKKPTLGDSVTRALLQDYHKIKYASQQLYNEGAERALEEVWELKVAKKKREKLMSEKEVRERKLLVGILKQQGNRRFREGEIENAVVKYTEGLEICIPKMRKQRVVLHSNRAQCYLLQRNPEAAISDATRALCLSGPGRPHSKSLWRRSQAYDMKGLAKESLMDCLLFVRCRIKSKNSKNGDVPYYAARMINKQMNATWVFASVGSRMCGGDEADGSESMGGRGAGKILMKKMKETEDSDEFSQSEDI